MNAVETLRATLPETAKDIKLNLQAVLTPGAPLSGAQRWGVAIASAVASRSSILRDALVADASPEVGPGVVDDAIAAAVLMGMNNVYYRFRHLIGNPSYSEKPPRLRMNRIARPLGSKVDFELFCLAVSAINGCESCMKAHEKVVLQGGLTEDHVHDAIRVAATVHAAAVALDVRSVTPSSEISSQGT